MPDPSLERYLAQHYYSGPKSDAILKRYGEDGSKKKKRKKHTESGDALVIKDQSSVWFGEDPDTEDMEGVVPEAITEPEHTRKPERSTKSQGWVSVREAEPNAGISSKEPSPAVQEASPFEKVPRTGTQETTSLNSMAEPVETPAPAPIKAGLMSGAQLRAQREAREAAERAEREREAAEADADIPTHQETVYRDASGRRIDPAEEEARIRQEHLSAEQKKREREQWNQGLVQRREREAKRRELESMQHEGVVRYVF